MELYEVTVEYVKYLRKFEPTKIMSNADGKEQRKFLGVIVQKNGYKYVIPLSSPKYKKDYKIRDYQGDFVQRPDRRAVHRLFTGLPGWACQLFHRRRPVRAAGYDHRGSRIDRRL